MSMSPLMFSSVSSPSCIRMSDSKYMPKSARNKNGTYLEWKEDYNLFTKKALSADSQYFTDETNVWKFLLVYLEGDNLTIDQTVELHFAYSLS